MTEHDLNQSSPDLPNGTSRHHVDNYDPPPREDDWDEEDERRASEERYETKIL